MSFSHSTTTPCQWFCYLAAALDRRSAVRLAVVFIGAVLARGRRTVTSWIRAAGLSSDYKPVYTAVAAAGKRADSIAARLATAAVKPLVAGAGRLTLALDDTPTKRYGPHVQGAGVHHNPAPCTCGPYRWVGVSSSARVNRSVPATSGLTAAMASRAATESARLPAAATAVYTGL